MSLGASQISRDGILHPAMLPFRNRFYVTGGVKGLPQAVNAMTA
jgi:hypothetical protein